MQDMMQFLPSGSLSFRSDRHKTNNCLEVLKTAKIISAQRVAYVALRAFDGRFDMSRNVPGD